MGMWEAFYRICSELILSGYGIPVLLSIVFVATVIGVFGGMESVDKKSTILAILGWPLFGITGWLIAICIGYGAHVMLRFQQRTYERQLETMRNNKNEALEAQGKLPLTFTPPPSEN
jgi:hypothetical protein